MTEPAVRVEAGAIVALRLYDVAFAIDLKQAEERGTEARAGVARARLTRAKPKAIAFGVPPVEIGLGARTLEVGGERREAEATARIYEFGVISLALKVPVTGASWDGFVRMARDVGRATADVDGGDPWGEFLDRVRTLIAPAMHRPTPTGIQEDYLITVVNRFADPVDTEDLLRRVDLAPLLSGEDRDLSDGARQDLLKNRFSYYRDDLAVLTWDHAFLVEPEGEGDVADVLEVANAQLVELRYYDELLDRELRRMYERLDQTRGRFRSLARRRFADLARDLHTRVAEVSEVREKVDDTLKVTEDVYLARVYGAALTLFRVDVVTEAVDRKLGIIRETYGTLYDEATAVRLEILEAVIVVLILISILLAL